MDVQMWTFEDALVISETFVRNSEKPSLDQETIRICIESALRELCECHSWKAMVRSTRVFLQPTMNVGSAGPEPSVAGGYCYANNANTPTTYGTTTVNNEIIIQGTKWPGYESPLTTTLAQAGITVLDGELRLGQYSLNCLIDSVIDSTHAVLDPVFHPSLDYPTASSFMLGFPKYPLPPDFAAGIIAAEKNAWFIGTYVPPDQWFLMDKYRIFTGIIRNYTFLPDPKRYGQTALYVHPCPQIASEYDLQIKAWRRPMRLSGKEPWNYQGNVTVTSGNAAVTGNGTAFDQRMVGAVLRVAGAGTQKPTGTAGKNPYLFQQTIASVTDAGDLVLSNPAPSFPSGATTLSNVGYSVSDPCDVPASLWDCFKALCQAELAQYVSPKEYTAIRQRTDAKLRSARAADNQDRSAKVVGSGIHTQSRLRDNPWRPVIGGPGT